MVPAHPTVRLCIRRSVLLFTCGLDEFLAMNCLHVLDEEDVQPCHARYINHNLTQVSPLPSTSSDSTGFSNTIGMDQFSLDQQHETSPLIHELAKRLLSYESAVAEIKRTLEELNCKVYLLLAQSNVNHPPESDNTFAENVAALDGPGPAFALDPHQLSSNATAPYQDLTYSGPGLDGEFGRPGVFFCGNLAYTM